MRHKKPANRPQTGRVAPAPARSYGLWGWGKAANCRSSERERPMSRVLAIAACGIALAACSSSGDVMKTATPTIPLQFESEPPGAEVKTSSGQTCKTPCALAVPAADFMVTYSLKGFEPQSVPVKLIPPEDPRGQMGDLETNIGGEPPRFAPNPVYAELEKAKPKPPARKKPRVAGSPPPRVAAPAQSAAPPPPTQRAPAPAPGPSPWPPAANPIR